MRGVLLGIAVLIAIGAIGCLHGSGKPGSAESAKQQSAGGEALPTLFAG